MSTQKGALRADLVLLLTAAIWGFAFVAQRAGMASIGPFTFNAVRYALGALSLLPFVLVRSRKSPFIEAAPGSGPSRLRRLVVYPLITGTVMFAGASLQQLGLVTTTAGNAAFITSLYVVLVPLLGLFAGRKVGPWGWIAAILSVAGLYLISVGGSLKVSPGDIFVLFGALFWAFHIIVIDRFAGRTDAMTLSAGQFLVCAVYSLLGALLFDPPTAGGLLHGIKAAALPLAYGGILSCGVAFTLQIVGQRRARPSHASIIMALEGLFGAIGGILFLGEPLGLRLAVGGALMLGGAVLSQLEPILKARRAA
jgi:drug/metabolite transporter (DMT)-like permease